MAEEKRQKVLVNEQIQKIGKEDVLCGEDGSKLEGEFRESGKFSKMLIFPWLLCCSVSALLLLAAILFFQMRLIEKDLVTLKERLSSFNGFLEKDEDDMKILRKRSWGSETKEDFSEFEGLQVAQLEGSLPIQHIGKEGRIGPWSLSTSEPNFVELHEGNTEIKILQKGVYFIYAQVYYLTSQQSNSFQILWRNATGESGHHRCLATCSSQARAPIGEVSCYTGVSASFRPGDTLYLNQVEQNRIIYTSKGYSHFGVVLLRKQSTLEAPK